MPFPPDQEPPKTPFLPIRNDNYKFPIKKNPEENFTNKPRRNDLDAEALRKLIEGLKLPKGGNKDLDALRESIVLEQRPNVTFDQIGGQPEAVAQARALAEQISHPEVFAQWGVSVPRGVLFYGEPGNGKTLIAKALAHETDAAFLLVNATDIASKWYGDAEKLARGIFEIAREEAEKHGGHCIIFFDEVDALIPTRQGNVHEASRKVIAEILTQIDGVNDNKGITVIASTNTPEGVDKAFLSRMTEWIRVDNPNEEGVAQIMQLHFAQASQQVGRALLADDIDFTAIAHEINGVSGRDIADIVQAILRMKALQQLHGAEPTQITKDDILAAVTVSAKAREAKKTTKRTPIGFGRNQ